MWLLLSCLLMVAAISLWLRNRKQMQHLLQSAMEFDYSPTATAIVNTSGYCIKVNDAFCTLLGYSKQELLGIETPTLISPLSEISIEHITRTMRSETTRQNSFSLLLLTKDNQPVHVYATVSSCNHGNQKSLIVTISPAPPKNPATHNRNDLLDIVLANAELGFWYWDIAHETITVDSGWRDITGIYPDHQLRDFTFLIDYIHPADRERYQKCLDAHMTGETEEFICQYRLRSPYGEELWIQDAGQLISTDSDGKPTAFCGTIKSLAEKVDAEDALAIASLLHEHTSEGLAVFDENMQLVFCNPAFCHLCGVDTDIPQGTQFEEINLLNALSPIRTQIADSLLSGDRWRDHKWLVKANGENLFAEITLTRVPYPDGSTFRHLIFLSDLTAVKLSQEQFWHQAHYDELTGIPNRLSLIEEIKRRTEGNHKGLPHCWLLLADLDSFKEINQGLGIDVGNLALKEVALRLQHFEEQGCLIARLGANAFGILSPLGDRQCEPTKLAKEVLDVLSKPFALSGYSLYLSASVGLAQWPTQADNASELINHAEQAMYLAKSSNNENYAFFENSLKEQRQKNLQMIVALRQALEENQFVIYLQPIIDFKSGRAIKAEALIRWQHPEKGLIMPSEFIPVAEESGLIIPLGEWTMRTVMAQQAAWLSMGLKPIQITVNKSPRQLNSPSDANETWLKELSSLGFKGSAIAVEITENILLDASPIVQKRLLHYRDAGIQVAMDDFGTGYSSLAYLKKFDIDYIKIDQSFIHNVLDDLNDRALCEAIILMAHKMNIRVIAEGVELQKQADLLIEMGCDFGQGYLYAPALPIEKFAESYLGKETTTKLISPEPGRNMLA